MGFTNLFIRKGTIHLAKSQPIRGHTIPGDNSWGASMSEGRLPSDFRDCQTCEFVLGGWFRGWCLPRRLNTHTHTSRLSRAIMAANTNLPPKLTATAKPTSIQNIFCSLSKSAGGRTRLGIHTRAHPFHGSNRYSTISLSIYCGVPCPNSSVFKEELHPLHPSKPEPVANSRAP